MKKKFLLRLTWSIEGTLSRRVERKRWFEGRSVDFDAISSRREPRKRGGRRRKRSWTREGNGLKYILHPFASRPFEVHTPLTCPFLDTTCFTTSLPFLSPAEIFRRSWKRSKGGRGGGRNEGIDATFLGGASCLCKQDCSVREQNKMWNNISFLRENTRFKLRYLF